MSYQPNLFGRAWIDGHSLQAHARVAPQQQQCEKVVGILRLHVPDYIHDSRLLGERRTRMPRYRVIALVGTTFPRAP